MLTSALDKKIKIWNFLTKELMINTSVSDAIQNISYIKNTVIFLNFNCEIGFWKENFEEIFEKTSEINDNNKLIENNEQEKPEEKIEEEKNIRMNENAEHKPFPLMDLNLIKKKAVPSKADRVIDCLPQNIVYSSSTGFLKNRRFLCWNYIGSISLRLFFLLLKILLF